MKQIDLQEKLKSYTEQFNREDEELSAGLILNRDAFRYLSANIPLLDCPDKEIERTYYFRWWTFRKHWRFTGEHHIITEFLPDVPWSGAFNSINCPCGFHIREGRWLADTKGWMKEYIRFWLDGKGDAFAYSCWLPHAVYEYCSLHNDWDFAISVLPQLIAFFEKRKAGHLHPSGLYWSDDDRDGMEYSVSGPGFRPTLNSYAYGDAMAISEIALLAGENELSRKYRKEAENVKAAINAVLWDGDFYKTLPKQNAFPTPLPGRKEIPESRNVRELTGYIPWYFGLADQKRDIAFSFLTQASGFLASAGLTTAERCHPEYGRAHGHECLWNGPVWPFATSQVLTAAARMLREIPSRTLNKEDFYALLQQYARSHCRITEEGKKISWIDENMDPETGCWLSRDILESRGWPDEAGGYERGKDYNHSLFCDLILSGLLGIGTDQDGRVTVDPLIPDDWNYFCVDQLVLGKKKYRIVFDRTGLHYGQKPGLTVTEL